MKLFVAAICLLCCGCAFGQDKPFIVTFPPFDSTKPIFLQAENSIWALANCCGATVWTREEWEGAHKTCVESKIRMDENCDKLFPLQAPPPSEAKQQLICDWATDHWFCPTDKPIADSFGLLEPSGKVTVTPAPFDVPAKEWDGPDTHAANTCPPPDEKGITGPCTAVYIEEKTHHVACEDKRRFLLTAEDGTKHCMALK